MFYHRTTTSLSGICCEQDCGVRNSRTSLTAESTASMIAETAYRHDLRIAKSGTSMADCGDCTTTLTPRLLDKYDFESVEVSVSSDPLAYSGPVPSCCTTATKLDRTAPKLRLLPVEGTRNADGEALGETSEKISS